MNAIRKGTEGYTLLEMIAVTIILSIVGLTSAFVVIESIKIYARVSPAIQAEYGARLASERMKRDIRGMSDAATISVLAPTELAFLDEDSQLLVFKLIGSDLYRNTDVLVQGLTAFAFTYWTADGTGVTNPLDLHLVEIDLTTEVAQQPFRAQTVAFPRCQAR